MKNFLLALLATVLAGAIYATPAVKKSCFEVEGMTCAACPLTVKTAVKKLEGIQKVTASLEDRSAVVEFDSDKTTTDAIKNMIDSVGYKAKIMECKI
jgi:mercuric ion binding protein